MEIIGSWDGWLLLGHGLRHLTCDVILNFTLLVKLFPFVVGWGQAICVIGEFHVICGSKSMPLTGPSKLRFLSGTLIDLFNIFTTSGAQHKRHLF